MGFIRIHTSPLKLWFLSLKRFILFLITFVYLCVSMCILLPYPLRPEERIGSLAAGVTGVCEPPDVDAMN